MIYSNIDLGSLISKKEIISFDNTKISYLFSKPNEKERKEIGWENRENFRGKKAHLIVFDELMEMIG